MWYLNIFLIGIVLYMYYWNKARILNDLYMYYVLSQVSWTSLVLNTLKKTALNKHA